jgi:enoyl-CoA hydratase/carnithine racemase
MHGPNERCNFGSVGSGELRDAVKVFDTDDAIGCIVITGSGARAFAAGGTSTSSVRTIARLSQEGLNARRGRRGYEIAASAKPTIGMISGLAYRGAAALASSPDMRVGCEASRFRFLAAAYSRINRTWTFTNQVGWPANCQGTAVHGTGRRSRGVPHRPPDRLLPREQLRAKTINLARRIAGNNPPRSSQGTSAEADGTDLPTEDREYTRQEAFPELREGSARISADLDPLLVGPATGPQISNSFHQPRRMASKGLAILVGAAGLEPATR